MKRSKEKENLHSQTEEYMKVNSTMIYLKEREKWNIQTEMFMKVSLIKVKSMEKEFIFIRMVINTKVSGKKAKNREKEFSFLKKKMINMMGILMIIKSTVREYILLQMEMFMKGILITGWKKDREHWLGQAEKNTGGHFKTIRCMDKE